MTNPRGSDAPQFIIVIDNCSAVAMDTQTKYGNWANAFRTSAGRP
jgi:hypothetical protein